MKKFETEQYGGYLHIYVDGWSIKTKDKDICKREYSKWLDECNED